MMSAKQALQTPRHLLILLGIFAQGHIWDRLWLVPVHVAVGVGAVMWGARRPLRISYTVQLFALVAMFYVIVQLALALDYGVNRFVFFGGNVVLGYQLMLLVQQIDKRHQQWSVVCAIMHLGIGTQVVVNYMAIPVLLASIYLIPRSLFDLESAGYRGAERATRPVLNRSLLLGLAALMVAFFLFFPRLPVVSKAAPVIAGPATGPLARRLDMTQTAGQTSDQIVFRIEGDGVEHIKTMALDTFDGAVWTASHWVHKRSRGWNWQPPENSRRRKVTMFSYKHLDSRLPIDGYVHNLSGSLFQHVFVTGDGGVSSGTPFRRNEVYEYVSTPTWRGERLNDRERRRYLALPPQSAELKQWLSDIIGSETEPRHQAERLVQNFQANFDYQLGGYDLDRLNPLDDFIFVQRVGHCERFASALAALLRMLEIPSRVVVGYVAREKNDLGGFYNVRVSHAHAWTEAYFDGVGWQALDGTPYGTQITMTERELGLTVLEWIENTWYSKIVEFDSQEQNTLLAAIHETIVPQVALDNHVIASIIAALLAVFIVWRIVRAWPTLRWRFQRSRAVTRANNVLHAQHFYGRLLRALARQDCYRKPSQTPHEFLAVLEEGRHPRLDDIRMVTDCFCGVRYGNVELTPELERRVRKAVDAVSRRR